MSTTRTWYLETGLALCCAASAAAGQTTRDSAGIRIVESAAPAWKPGQEWTLSREPVLVIGGAAGSEDRLGRIVGATRLSDGRVVVGDASTLQLRFYDASGGALHSVRGEGPSVTLDNGLRLAEPNGFQSISRMAGDTIAIQRMHGESLLSPGGTVVREVQFGPFAPGVLEAPMVAALGRFDGGGTVVADYPQGRRGPAGAKQWVDSASLFLADRAGAVVRRLGRAPMVTFIAGPEGPHPMDLGPTASYATSGKSFYWGFPDEFAVRVYDADWKLQRIVRRTWTPRPFTAADRDAYVDGWMARWSRKTGAEREAERREMIASRYPDVLPAYSAMLASPTGELWLREPDLTAAPGCWCFSGISAVPSRWSVFDPEGRWLGEVAMPPLFIPLEIGADYVLGRSRGADDVQRAVMYRIDRPR